MTLLNGRSKRTATAFARLVLTMLLFAVVLASSLEAATITITVTGNVHSGTDYSGFFGLGTNANLATKSYQLVYTFNDYLGTKAVDSCGSPSTPYSSYTSGTGTSSPGTAQLTINSVTYTFGVNGSSTDFSSEAKGEIAACGGQDQVFYIVQDFYSTIGNNYFRPSSGSWSNGYDWRSPVSSTTNVVSSNSNEFDFNFDDASGNYAIGVLSPSNITIQGPVCDSPLYEGTSWDTWAPSYGPDPSDPTIGGYVQTLYDMNSSSTIFSGGTVTESNAAPATDGCYTSASTNGHTPTAFGSASGTLGGSATVNAANQWGDVVGYTSNSSYSEQVQWYQSYATLACYYTAYQQMTYSCPSSGGPYPYGGTNSGSYNILYAYINDALSLTDVTVYRSGVESGSH